jgi:hypothetical protein
LIDAVVAGVLAQDGIEGVEEVLVVGRDEPGRLRPGGRVRLIDTVRPVSEPVARNLGLAATRADLVLFLDSDCLPQPGWLREHLAAHAAGHRLVSGSVLAEGEGYWPLVYNLSLFYAFLESAPGGPRPSLPTLNLSLTRGVAEAVGPFDESLTRATDLDWTLRARRAGLGLRFWPAAAVLHRHPRRTLAAVWRDCAGSGFHSRRIRLRHAELLGTPWWLRSRLAVRALSPWLALWVTTAVAARWPATFRGRWHTLPAFLLTKLAWGWGASAPGARA